MELTVVYVTSRREPFFEWFLESLSLQAGGDDTIDVIVIDSFAGEVGRVTAGKTPRTFNAFTSWNHGKLDFRGPKPTVWQGEHRLTKEDWWAKSNALNTGICLCKTEWIAFCDDRSVLWPGWLNVIEVAMEGNYAVCGRYEKRQGVKVENGIITDMGVELGLDHRPEGCYPTDNWMGGHGALPLEWCLAVNVFSEDLCDSLGSEDSMFGSCLYNAGFTIKYDSQFKIIEDRTPGQLDGALKRADKGVSPNDKSHEIVKRFAGKRHSMNSYNIRDLRDKIQRSEPWPKPTASDRDWFDNQLVSEME